MCVYMLHTVFIIAVDLGVSETGYESPDLMQVLKCFPAEKSYGINCISGQLWPNWDDPPPRLGSGRVVQTSSVGLMAPLYLYACACFVMAAQLTQIANEYSLHHVCIQQCTQPTPCGHTLTVLAMVPCKD